ncbi:MAG TPA: type VI secretion system tube protein Hcp [Pyrinomonadaceae bacterium]|nr:type VI secretion system tube protein Hcp [Pyrinomonadaceae bacterium]
MAVDVFLKIEGVPGESKDSVHAGEIDVKAWTWSCANLGTAAGGGGIGAGIVSMQDFCFTQEMQKSSNVLMQKCATGEHIPKAVLTCRKAGSEQQEYLKVTFCDLIVSNYVTCGSNESGVPLENISLNFASMVMEYAEQKIDGSMEGFVGKGWDQKAKVKKDSV